VGNLLCRVLKILNCSNGCENELHFLKSGVGLTVICFLEHREKHRTKYSLTFETLQNAPKLITQRIERQPRVEAGEVYWIWFPGSLSFPSLPVPWSDGKKRDPGNEVEVHFHIHRYVLAFCELNFLNQVYKLTITCKSAFLSWASGLFLEKRALYSSCQSYSALYLWHRVDFARGLAHSRLKVQCHRLLSIVPKFPEISVEKQMESFGPGGNFPEKVVHYQRWFILTGRCGPTETCQFSFPVPLSTRNFGWNVNGTRFSPVGNFSMEQCRSIFPWLVPLVSDRSIWQNGKYP